MEDNQASANKNNQASAKKVVSRIQFEHDYDVWFYIIKYLRQHDYKISGSKPMSLKMYVQIRNVISPKKVSAKDLYRGIGFHVNSIAYLKIIKVNQKRWNLFGKPDGRVTQKEANFALQQMALIHPAYMKSLRKSRAGKQTLVVEKKGRKLVLNKGKMDTANK
jgi:sRNA-binding protein